MESYVGLPEAWRGATRHKMTTMLEIQIDLAAHSRANSVLDDRRALKDHHRNRRKILVDSYIRKAA
jgi:hypothetical protein